MEYDNYALKEWLLRVGTVRRKIILQKLKSKLDECGLTQQEVYGGLLQLVMRPRVLLTRSSITESPHLRSHANEDIAECEESFPKKSIQENTADVGGEKLSAASAASESLKESDRRCVKIEVSSIEKTTIPELLDENVGNRISPNLVKVPRTAITLNLNSHGAANAKKDVRQVRSAPEIRIADSSVPDEEGSAQDTAEKCICKRDRSGDKSAAKRPRIVEDLICIEGTIFSKSLLPNNSEPLAVSCLPKKLKRDQIIEEELASVTANAPADKSENMNIEETKKWRVRKKFRQLFGKTPTLSEIDEENELMKEFIPKKRRKKSRMSLDSGVGFSETASERVLNSPDIQSCDTRPETLERRFPAVQNEINSVESEEKSCDHDALLRSMPLPESVSPGEIGEYALSKTLPDSSTNFEDKSEVNLDGFSGKLTILISPIDTLGADSFAPMSIEIDLSSGSQVSTATSTTQFPSEGNYTTAEETTENYDDLSKLLEMNLQRDFLITQQGNTIRIHEEADARVIPPDAESTEKYVEIESRVVDIARIGGEGCASTTQTTCQQNTAKTSNSDISTVQYKDLNQKTISSATETCNNDDELNVKEFNERTIISSATDDVNSQVLSKPVDPAPEIENIVVKEEFSNVNELRILKEQQSTVEDTPTPKKSTETQEARSTSAAELANTEKNKSAPNPMPRLRVLHHTELGSRWCPTPNNGNDTSICRTETFPGSQPPVSPISTIEPHLQAVFNAEHPLPESQLKYLHLLVLNTAPVITNITPELYSKDSPNGYDNPKTQPVYLPPDYSVQQEITNSKKAPTPMAGDFQSNPPTYSASANDSFVPPHSSMLAHIFDYLLALQWCIERCQFAPSVYNPVQLRKEFFTKKTLLRLALQKYCEALGTYDLKNVVQYIVRYYEYLMRPEERILSVDRVLYILKLDDLPLLNYVGQGQNQSSTPPPPRRPHTSQNSATCTAQNAQRCSVISKPEFTSPTPSPTVAATGAVGQKRCLLSPKQMKTLYEQIIAYNYINKTLQRQLNALYQKQQAERYEMRRENPKVISLQEKLKKKTINRGMEQWQPRMVASSLEENIRDEQPELRQSPVAFMRQNVIASQKRIVHTSRSTFFPPSVDNVSAQQKTPREPILCFEQAMIPLSVVNINTHQDVEQSSANSAQKFTAQDPIICSSSSSIPVQMDDTGAHLELRKSPFALSQQSPPRELILRADRTNIAVTTDNADTLREVRQSPSATIDKITLQELIRNIRRNIPVSIDNTDAQLQQRQSPAAQIDKNTVNSNSKIIPKLPDNECNVRVVDVLKELDTLSPVANGNRSKSGRSRSSIASSHTESLPLAPAIIPADLIAPSDTDKTTKIREGDEENNSCASIKSDHESTESAASRVPVITIEDEDDIVALSVRSIESSETLIESSVVETARITDEETKGGTLPESAEPAAEAENESIDGTSCEIGETGTKILEERPEIFSILDVKSISKDVFNNMGVIGEIEPPSFPRVQEPTETDSVHINHEILPNCFRCSEPSFVVCEQCCLAFYCSTECHQAHWRDTHHLSCKPESQEAQL